MCSVVSCQSLMQNQRVVTEARAYVLGHSNIQADEGDLMRLGIHL